MVPRPSRFGAGWTSGSDSRTPHWDAFALPRSNGGAKEGEYHHPEEKVGSKSFFYEGIFLVFIFFS